MHGAARALSQRNRAAVVARMDSRDIHAAPKTPLFVVVSVLFHRGKYTPSYSRVGTTVSSGQIFIIYVDHRRGHQPRGAAAI